MQNIIGVYVVLFVFIGVMYFIARKTRGDQVGSFWTWLKSSVKGRSNSGPVPKRTASRDEKPLPSAMPIASNDNDVVAVLEDLYAEFVAETEKLRNELAQRTEALERVLMHRVEQLAERVATLEGHAATSRLPTEITPARSVQRSEDDTEVDRQSKASHKAHPFDHSAGTEASAYLAILTGLHAGQSPEEISKAHGVSRTEVELVRKMMASEPSDGAD